AASHQSARWVPTFSLLSFSYLPLPAAIQGDRRWLCRISAMAQRHWSSEQIREPSLPEFCTCRSSTAAAPHSRSPQTPPHRKSGAVDDHALSECITNLLAHGREPTVQHRTGTQDDPTWRCKRITLPQRGTRPNRHARWQPCVCSTKFSVAAAESVASAARPND